MNPYDRFREKLDTAFPLPTPATKSRVEIEILSKLMLPEEAGVACNLSPQPENAQTIADRAGISVEEIRPVLDNLAEKGVIFKVYADDPLYCLVPMIPGIFEFQVGTITPELVNLFERYYAEGIGKAFFGLKTPVMRVIPVSDSIASERSILTYEEVDNIIDQAASIALTQCLCRTSRRLIGEGCDAPDDVCLYFDAWADFLVKSQKARRVSKGEARNAVRRAEEAGLVHQAMNVQEGTYAVCACCGCCCVALRAITQLKIPTATAKSSFIAEVAEQDCIGCGDCVDRCHTKALKLEGDTVTLLEERCIGCGVCASVCSSDAITMTRRAQQTIPAKTVNDLMEQIALSRG